MPQLLVFMPCEKILSDAHTGDISFIGLLDTLTVVVPAGVTIPEGTQIPFSWVAFTQWVQSEQESGELFEQRVELFTPTGESGFDSINPLFPEGPLHRHAVKVARFPVGMEGIYSLQLSVREITDDKGWQVVTTFPIRVRYEKQSLDSESDQG